MPCEINRIQSEVSQVTRKTRTTAFLAAFLMIYSMVFAAPAAHAGEKKHAEAATGTTVPVEVEPSGPVTTDRGAKTSNEVKPSGGGGPLAESPAQKASAPVSSGKSTKSSSSSSSKVAPKASGNKADATSKKTSTKSGHSTTSKEAGNPNAGCYASPANSNTGHGANKSGVYDSTCDGSPSLNGNGSGSATGKPCAGCVGKADYKNPPGQMPNAELDGNRGYECDNNQGIGKTNPAHTGCKVGSSIVPPPVTNPPGNNPPGNPPEVKPDEVKPDVKTDGVAPPPEVLPLPPITTEVIPPVVRMRPGAPAPAAVLPLTGGDMWLFVIFGCGLIGAGSMALLAAPTRGRRLVSPF